MDYDIAMKKARAFVRRLERVESQTGAAAPSRYQLVRVAMEAIKAGITHNDWDCVAEGQVHLEMFLALFFQAMDRKLSPDALLVRGNRSYEGQGETSGS